MCNGCKTQEWTIEQTQDAGRMGAAHVLAALAEQWDHSNTSVFTSHQSQGT